MLSLAGVWGLSTPFMGERAPFPSCMYFSSSTSCDIGGSLSSYNVLPSTSCGAAVGFVSFRFSATSVVSSLTELFMPLACVHPSETGCWARISLTLTSAWPLIRSKRLRTIRTRDFLIFLVALVINFSRISNSFGWYG